MLHCKGKKSPDKSSFIEGSHMSEIQVGDQTSKPQDLEKTEAVLNAVIESEVKKQMASYSGFTKMMKHNGGNGGHGASGGVGEFAGGGGGGSSFLQPAENSGSSSSFLSSSGTKGRRSKASITIADMTATHCKFTRSKLDGGKIKAGYKMVEHAWAGKGNKQAKGTTTARSKDLIEECNLQKARMAWLPKGLVANKEMLPAYGFGHLLEAHNAIQAEKAKPAMAAIISGTANDMEKFSALFRTGLDEGTKEQVYAGASSSFKQKLNPLMSN